MTGRTRTRLSWVALMVLALAAVPASAQAPQPYSPTPDMIEAAKKEGRAVW